jgi:hypothetical protein
MLRPSISGGAFPSRVQRPRSSRGSSGLKPALGQGLGDGEAAQDAVFDLQNRMGKPASPRLDERTTFDDLRGLATAFNERAVRIRILVVAGEAAQRLGARTKTKDQYGAGGSLHQHMIFTQHAGSVSTTSPSFPAEGIRLSYRITILYKNKTRTLSAGQLRGSARWKDGAFRLPPRRPPIAQFTPQGILIIGTAAG